MSMRRPPTLADLPEDEDRAQAEMEQLSVPGDGGAPVEAGHVSSPAEAEDHTA